MFLWYQMIFPWLFPWLFPCKQTCVESLSFVTGPIIQNPKVSLCDDAEHLAQRSAGVGRSIQSYREVSVLDDPPKTIRGWKNLSWWNGWMRPHLTGRTGKMPYQIELSMFDTQNHTNLQIRGVFGHGHLGTWFSRSTTAVSIWWDIAIILCNLDMPTMEKGYMLQPILIPRCLQVVCCITFHQMKAIQLKMPGVAGTTTPNFKSILFESFFVSIA